MSPADMVNSYLLQRARAERPATHEECERLAEQHASRNEWSLAAAWYRAAAVRHPSIACREALQVRAVVCQRRAST